jgi:hypothetical protein
MNKSSETDARLLTLSERKMVSMTREPGIAKRSREELKDLSKRLREARDRASGIARRQRREMRGKSDPRGTKSAKDNTGTLAKTIMLDEALTRVDQALRRIDAPTQPELSLKALEMKRAGRVTHHPAADRSASKGMQAKASIKPTVRANPREIGRVSKAVKIAQAKRDT